MSKLYMLLFVLVCSCSPYIGSPDCNHNLKVCTDTLGQEYREKCFEMYHACIENTCLKQPKK
jgi:hypothetical protein